MNKRENGKWRKVAFGVTMAAAALSAYLNRVQGRSLRSWVVEKALWASRVKKATEEQPMERFAEMIAALEKINDKPLGNPAEHVTSELREEWREGMRVFIWNDRQDSEQKIIFYLHGSAYVNPPTPFHFAAVDTIAQEAGAKVVFPLYPKAPRYTFREAYPHVLSLYKQMLQSTSAPKNVTIMGDSSGGAIALGLAQLLKQGQLEQPKDIILLSPWLDAATDNPAIAKYDERDPMIGAWGLQQIGLLWAGGAEALSHPLVSPLYGDLTGLAPITLLVGTHEIFYPDVMRLDRLLTERGIPHQTIVQEKMDHDYAVHPIPEAREAQRRVAGIIKSP